MRVTIDADSQDAEVEMTFTNERLSNDNYVDLYFSDIDSEYTVSISDLHAAVLPFLDLREEVE